MAGTINSSKEAGRIWKDLEETKIEVSMRNLLVTKEAGRIQYDPTEETERQVIMRNLSPVPLLMVKIHCYFCFVTSRDARKGGGGQTLSDW